MDSVSPLAALCSIQNMVRSNYYSYTYRAKFRVGEESGEWDITRVSLPFPTQKEKEALVRFGLDRGRLHEFYVRFGKNLSNGLKAWKYLTTANVPGIVPLVTYEIVKKQNTHGSDCYIVTRPMEPAWERFHLYAGDKASVADILSLVTGALRTVQAMDATGCRIGLLDVDDLYVPPQGDGVLVGGFLYASAADNAWPGLPTKLPHTHPELANGEPPALAMDVYSICSLAWTLFSGSHYTTAPDLSVEPGFIRPELVKILQLGVNEDNVYLSDSELAAVIKELSDGLEGYQKKVQTEPGYGNGTITFAEPTFDLSQAR